MATNYKLGLLTAVALAACSTEETAKEMAESKTDKPKDNDVPTIEMKVNLINGVTYHPTLSVKTDDGDKLVVKETRSSVDNSEYVLSSDGSIKPTEEKVEDYGMVGNSSYLKEIVLYENGKPIITRKSTPEDEMYSSDYFSVDLKRTEGEYTYQVKAKDNAGNHNESPLLTLVFKNGYTFPKEDVVKDKTPPSVEFNHYGLGFTQLCASIDEFGPNQTGILEATLLDGDKVVYHYVANPKANPYSLDYRLYSWDSNGTGDRLCLTNLPQGKIFSNIPGLRDLDIPASETLAAVKNVVVVVKDFAGNQTRVAYVDTYGFKELSERVKRGEQIKKLEKSETLEPITSDFMRRFKL